MCIVKYNRSSREYEVTDEGEVIATFPAGEAGRQAARETAVSHQDPQVYALAFYLANDLYRNHHDLHPRIWKAAQLAMEKGVTLPRSTDPLRIHARAQSQANVFESYVLSETSGHKYHRVCNCPDFELESAPKIQGHRLCKHVLAWKIMLLLKRPLPLPNEPRRETVDEWTRRVCTSEDMQEMKHDLERKANGRVLNAMQREDVRVNGHKTVTEMGDKKLNELLFD